uniref:Uncharacterized protein n=1 Tax=Arundo donax TaxID=35708 RepID=A0A0A9D5Q1_ARUDO
MLIVRTSPWRSRGLSRPMQLISNPRWAGGLSFPCCASLHAILMLLMLVLKL